MPHIIRETDGTAWSRRHRKEREYVSYEIVKWYPSGDHRIGDYYGGERRACCGLVPDLPDRLQRIDKSMYYS